MKFHDGSDFDADAVVWNVEKVLKQDALHFDASQVGVTASRMPNLRSAKAIDKMTVELTTAAPDALLPINLTNLYMASPAQWKKLYDAVPASVDRPEGARQAGVGRVRAQRLGHRPVEDGASFVPRERLELVKNADYWNKDRVPKVDKLVLLPMPEANARTAALLSGQVEWIENPAPDALPQIKQRGFVALSERTAARLAVAVQPHRRLALERPPRAQGREPVRRSQRHEGRPARRPDGGGDRHVRARPSVARQSRSSRSSTIRRKPRS